MNKSLFFLIAFFFILSCNNKKNNKVIFDKKAKPISLIKYAKGFDIEYFNSYSKLTIKTPYPNTNISYEYFLIPYKNKIPKALKNKNIIRTPVKSVVATSTTHIPMIELLHEENSIKGFPQTQYISSKKTVALIQKNKIKNLGNARDINTEILLNLKPDLVIGFSLSNNNKMYENIENTGITVIFDGDWLEKTPLGRAEWIKFFGALYNKKNQADTIFNAIESKYKKAKKIALQAKQKPTILSGVLFKDKWNLPAGESFTAKLFKDANTQYLWENTKGTGSLVLSFESVFDKARNADFWIGSGIYTSFEEMQNSNSHYTDFKPFKNKKVFTFSKKRGVNGGVIYFELAPIKPHIVLQDLIKATHPELLPNYTPFFLEKLN